MTRLKPMSWQPAHAGPANRPWTHPARRVAAVALRRASATLARLARRLAMPLRGVRAQPMPPVLEFHADAGAPEGALYVDGKLIGWLSGVKRL